MRADPVAHLGPASGQELLLGVGGDAAAAGGARDDRHRVQIGVDQHQPGDEAGVPVGEHDGHGAAHAVGDQLDAGRTGRVQGGGQGVGMRLEGVRETLGPVAVPVPQQVDQQRAAAREERVHGARGEVGGRGRSQPVHVHPGGFLPGQLDPADPVILRCDGGTSHQGSFDRLIN